MTDLDRLVHEPARLRILTVLSAADSADFNFLLNVLDLTKGNLSSHMDKLESAGYVQVYRTFRGKQPHTDYRLSDSGRKALSQYWRSLDEIRAMSGKMKK